MARLREVAKLAGVSPGTASKVLNGRQGPQQFGAACEARIHRAAQQLGYRPNYLARSLSSRRAEAVGLLIGPGFMSTDLFWGQVVQGLADRLSGSGRHLVTIAGRDSAEQVDRAGQFLHEGRIDGLVLLSFNERFSPPAELAKTDRPMVLLGCEDPSAPTVTLDDAAGVTEAVEHLAGLGHRHILWLGPGDDDDSSCQRRRQACRRAVRKAGLRFDEQLFSWRAALGDRVHARSTEQQIASVWARCCRAKDFRQGATAAVCYDDLVAFGVYAAARERGFRIPDDLSVVGFDDLHAHCAWPPLTTVSHMLPAIGHRAAEILEVLIDTPASRPQYAGRTVLVPPRLIVRASTAAPRPDEKAP